MTNSGTSICVFSAHIWSALPTWITHVLAGTTSPIFPVPRRIVEYSNSFSGGSAGTNATGFSTLSSERTDSAHAGENRVWSEFLTLITSVNGPAPSTWAAICSWFWSVCYVFTRVWDSISISSART